MTRVSENQSVGSLINQMQVNKQRVDNFARQMSSGLRVFEPADSRQAAGIARLQDSLVRVDGHLNRLGTARAHLGFQEQLLSDATNTILRAREIAQQMANEGNSPEIRSLIVGEVWGLRNQLSNLANATYQGRYVYGGVDDDDPPFDPDTTTYTTFGSADSQVRFVFDNFDPPPTVTTPPERSIQIDDQTSIKISTSGDQVFSAALAAMEKLGRVLEGYRTDTTTPDYSAYTFPTDYDEQTQAILETLDELEAARANDIEPERASISERQRRIDVAENVLNFTKDSSKTVLSGLQDADIAESATNLTLAQTALQASYSVTSRLLDLSILNYL